MSEIDGVYSEIAYVLFLDMVGHSLMSLEDQALVSGRFKQLVRELCASQFRPESAPLALDGGDGVALVFFGGPSAAFDCAAAISASMLREGIDIRSGLHCGPVTRVEDVNGHPTVYGPGINLAERVMSCADPGQLLLSGIAAEMAAAQEKWRPFLEDLGEHEVKHGIKLRLVNLVTDDAGRRGVPARLQPNAGSRSRLNNFTEPERPFVGRRTERENLRHRLESERERLITITGPGGMGKTRLAGEVAKDLAANYADGAWIIECEVLSTDEDLRAQIAAVLGIEVGGNATLALRESLADKQLLLVFDCFERLVAHAGVLEDLLKHTTEIQMVVTSRVLLSLPGESEIVLGPLSMQRSGGATADAIALFVGAARGVVSGFRITRRNQETITAIVAAVEAVPLAVILAAGRLRHMSLSELLKQLEHDSLDVLKRRGAAHDRHANLTKVVEDSISLLREELKDLLVSLSVFRGGFRWADVREVLSDRADTLDDISELRDNSLLSAQIDADHMRFRTLDVIAEYVERIADPSRLEPIRRRHAEYFAKRATEVRSLYEEGRWREANTGLGAELGNYRRAIEYAAESGDGSLLRSLAASLSRLLMEAGYRADFERLVAAARRGAEDSHDLPLLIELTGLLGGVHRRDRNFDRAEEEWLARTSYCREANEVEMEADSWLDLADMALLHGAPAKADEYLVPFAELESRLPQGLVLASGYVARAKAAARKGDTEGAKFLADQAKLLADSLPHRMHSFYVWMSLADVFNQLGAVGRSEELCLQGIRESIAGSHYSYTGLLLCKLATSLEAQGQLDRAAEALAVAAMIPKSVSQTLRDQVRIHQEAFCQRYGSKAYSSSQKMTNGLSWQMAALELLEIN